MTNWSWVRAPRPVKAPEDPRPPFARTAMHIRGRVFAAGYRTRLGDAMWNMEVINTRTGEVLITDNCADRDSLLRVCIQATAAARAAWFYDFGKKAVR